MKWDVPPIPVLEQFSLRMDVLDAVRNREPFRGPAYPSFGISPLFQVRESMAQASYTPVRQ